MDSRMGFLGRTAILAGIVAVAVAFGVTAAQSGASVARAADEQVPGGESGAVAEGAATDEAGPEGAAAGAAATEAAVPAASEGAAEKATAGSAEGDASAAPSPQEEMAGATMTSTEEKAEPAGMSVGSIQLLVFMALLAMLMIVSYRGPKSRLSR